MKCKLMAVVILFCLSTGVWSAEMAGGAGTTSFRAEIEGRVEIDASVPDGAVRVVPNVGLPVRVGGASGGEWRGREGRWVEIKGRIDYDGTEPRIEIREFSLEDGPPWMQHSSIETEGIVVSGAAGTSLRTVLGEVRLVGSVNAVPSGVPVDVKGNLVLRDGMLAIDVTEIEVD